MKLSICPFCGSSHLSIEMIKPVWGSEQEEPYVVCNDCCSSSPMFIWNLRHIKTDSRHNKAKIGSNEKPCWQDNCHY